MVCSNCGTRLEPGATRCPGCGAILVADPEAYRQAQMQAQQQAAQQQTIQQPPVEQVPTPTPEPVPTKAPASAPEVVQQPSVPQDEYQAPIEAAQVPTNVDAPGESIQESAQEEIEQIEMPSLAEDDETMEVFDEIDLPLISRDDNGPKGSVIASFEQGYEEDEELEQFDADTAAPDLELLMEDENLSSMTDITNQTDVSDYEVLELPDENEPRAEEATGVGSAINAQKEDINIAIPTAERVVVDVQMPEDGSAPVIIEEDSVGVVQPDSEKEIIKISKFEIKLKKGTKNSLLNMGWKCAVSFAIGFFFVMIFFPTRRITYRAAQNTKLKTSINQNKNNIVTEADYVYTIPQAYQIDRYLGGLYIYEPDGQWRMYIRPVDANYTLLRPAKISISESLQYGNLIQKRSVSGISERQINDNSYFVIKMTDGLYPKVIIATPSKLGDEERVFFCEISAFDGRVTEELYNIADDILSHITKNDNQKKNLNVISEDIIDKNIRDLYSQMEAAAGGKSRK